MVENVTVNEEANAVSLTTLPCWNKEERLANHKCFVRDDVQSSTTFGDQE